MKRTVIGCWLLVIGWMLGLGVGVRADLVKQSTAYTRVILMQDSTVSRSPGVAGLTLTINASKNGGAFAAITPTVTDLGNGYYALALTNAHTNTLGSLELRISGTGADDTPVHDQVVAFDPADAAALGLSRIDAAISTRSTYAGADTSGTTTLLTRIPGTVQPQTGDAFARLGAPAGASISADIAAMPSAGAAAVWAAATRTLSASQAFNLTGNVTGSLSGSVGSVTGTVGSVAGGVTIGGYAAGQDPATLLSAMSIDGTLTWKQLNAIQASIALDGDRSFNAATHIAILTYYRRAAGGTAPDKTRPILIKTTTYDSSNTQVVSQSIQLSNLP